MIQTKNLTEQLVTQCKRGNERARLALYKQFVTAMYNVAYRIVGNQFDAEDVVQDAFVKVFRNIDQLKEPKAFGAWLKQTVINQSLSLIRKQKRLKVIVDVLENLPDFEAEEQVDDFPVEVVLAAVLKLPEGARVVFTLRVIEGYKFCEIAELIGLTENNCKVQFHRSKRLLSHQLKNKLYV